MSAKAIKMPVLDEIAELMSTKKTRTANMIDSGSCLYSDRPFHMDIVDLSKLGQGTCPHDPLISLRRQGRRRFRRVLLFL